MTQHPDPVIRCSKCGITIFTGSDHVGDKCTGCGAADLIRRWDDSGEPKTSAYYRILGLRSAR